MVAFGAYGSSEIEIHSISNNNLVSKGTMRGLSSSVTHIDWTFESNLIQANSDAYELKFFSLSHMKHIKSASTRDLQWHTVTCKYGWSVQGIYPDQDGEGIDSCCRAKNQKVLATGEDNGQVKIFRYPSTAVHSGFKAYKAHSGSVKNLQFMNNDTYLVSSGSSDSTIIVWKTDFGCFEGLEEDEYTELNYEEIDMTDIQSVNPIEEYSKYGKNIKNYDQGKEIGTRRGPNNMFEVEDIDQGDQFMAIKPWQATIKPPRKFLKPPVGYSQAPKVEMELHHVFGYHSNNVRNNLRILPIEYGQGASVVYFTAGVGINHNIDANKQKFFQKHTNEITSMDLSEDKKLVATGQRGKHPKIYIWDSETMI